MLGFTAYTISTGAFLYSPTIRSQYAFRHPAAPEPTVRFNDFLFALHGAVLCIITYSQFYARLWGFKVGPMQRTSNPIIAIFWGSILGVLVTASIVLSRGKDGGFDPRGWAWIEVVCAFRTLWGQTGRCRKTMQCIITAMRWNKDGAIADKSPDRSTLSATSSLL